MSCPHCGAGNPPAYRFCDHCGQGLEPASGHGLAPGAHLLRIGRALDMEICLDPDAQQVSRHHADVIEYPDGRLELVDRGSANHTYLNGRELAPDVPQVLQLVDTVELGSYTFNTALVREQLRYDKLDVRSSAGSRAIAAEPAVAESDLVPVAPTEAPQIGLGGMSGPQYALLAVIALLVLAVILAAVR